MNLWQLHWAWSPIEAHNYMNYLILCKKGFFRRERLEEMKAHRAMLQRAPTGVSNPAAIGEQSHSRQPPVYVLPVLGWPGYRRHSATPKIPKCCSDVSRIFSCRPPAALPDFTVGGTVIPLCTQYSYLGAPVKISTVFPAGRQTHPPTHDLLDCLQRRLQPLQWLTNNSSGISIPVARTIYITFIRSVVDYLSPALVQLPRTTLEPLEIVQKRAMRVILRCPMSTRIENMQCELRLPPLVEIIYSNVTRLTVKCLHFPHLSPHYSQLIRMSLGPARPVPPILPAGRALIRSVSSLMRSLDLDIPVADVPPGPPPWLLPMPEVSLTPASKSDPPPLQLQLALEHVATVTSSITAPHCLYTDGSLQSDGAAGCALFSPDLEPPPGG
ncbi:uncharacterized protein LOC126992111 isoform X3 [Eriocheir sinensis]|uniref:uncharacterized protein LOC126992111 isoform X3 n=1 Tax=Eriocheir sinensis TaxID=95602 RepID=UPI0021C69C93|nr:uncharacterized protein LOC126992111 isoform X3 [Eriocheir sinensis]